MITAIIKCFSKKTSNVRIQIVLALMYGLISLYGHTGALMIVLKMRKLGPPRKKTVKP